MEQAWAPDLDCEVFVHQQVGRLEVPVDYGRHAGVQVIHAPRNVDCKPHPALLIQDQVGRPAHTTNLKLSVCISATHHTSDNI